jgi:predicted metalloendopeptidase
LTLCCAFALVAGCAAPEQDTANRLTREEIAETVVASMNPDADPCEDFYEYACGRWIETTELPGDETRWARSFSVVDKRNREVLREILETSSGAVDSRGGKLGNFYAACMDDRKVEAAGVEPLQPYLERIAGVEDGATLLDVVAEMQAAEIGVLFRHYVLGDFKNPEINITHFFQGGLGLPDRDYYFEADKREDLENYERHVARMFELLGESPEDAAADAEEIVVFETELARVSRKRAEMRDVERLYNKIDVPGLQELTPGLPWERYFAGIGYPDLVELNVGTPEFFERLETLVSESDPGTLQTYLRWHLLTAMADQLPQPFVDENFDFYSKQLRGQEEIRPRWRRCVRGTNLALGEALGQSYVERRFPGESKQIAQDMIYGIEGAFEAGLVSLGWMDEQTRERSVEKMEALLHKIGYPDEWRDYSALTVEPGDYFGNVVRAHNFEFKRNADKAGEPVDPTEWGMPPSMVNAYYNPLINEIVFPAGILQDPFFHRDFPAAMNFGGIGAVMGHELTHGFDDMGSKFDPEGRMEPWWAAEAIERFEDQTQCVEDLYSTYELQPDLYVNGKLTLGENIADLGGVKEAFRAYKSHASESDEPLVDSLTDDQLFFVAFGQTWCMKATEEVEQVLIATDSHSPARFRAEGPLANLPEFAEAFACDPGTRMNPVDKCEVW